MASSIEVNKKKVCDFLAEGNEHRFIIPEYQRPYEWSEDQIETLFNDLVEFSASEKSANEDYFLGCIVFFENDGRYEIIDGQQRLTSLLLFLRAIYAALENGEKTDEANNFISKIEKAIWPEEELTGKPLKDQTLLESHVIDSNSDGILSWILTTGTTKEDSTDNYSKNFRKFQELYSGQSEKDGLFIYHFLNDIIKHVIVFPIQADTQETALRIFSTLNDRGLPLSDADIFKAKIYDFLDESSRDSFIRDWKALSRRAIEADESIQQLFYYYMFYLRAEEGDTNVTTPGIRRYYAENKFARLRRQSLLEDLNSMMDIWEVANSRMIDEGKPWTANAHIRKLIDTLRLYPNEFWKYPVAVYYLKYKHSWNFEPKFLAFLKKLAAELITRFLKSPTVNAVKPGIMKLNAAILESDAPSFEFGEIDWTELRSQIKLPNKRSFRMLLALQAYTEQDELLPQGWQIEHIFPRKWQPSHFPSYNDEVVNERIEHIGNKIPFERKLNIVASNGYFEKKQEAYAESSITVAKQLSRKTPASWDLSDIDERDVRVTDTIIDTLRDWCNEYSVSKDVGRVRISEEDAEMLKELKRKYGKAILDL